MAEFIYSTESEVKGPFLIERTQLESLNHILSEEWVRFEKERARELVEAVEEEVKEDRKNPVYKEYSEDQLRKESHKRKSQSHRFSKCNREYLIFLKNGSAAKVNDFEAALKEPDLQDKEANGFYASLESGSRSCEVTLTGDRKKLRIKVSPERDQLVLQTLMVLKNWQNSVRPPLWQKIWSAANGIQWFVLLMLCVFMSNIFERSVATPEYQQQAKSATYLINTNSLSVEDQAKAIQLILAKSYGNAPTKNVVILSNHARFIMIAAFIYSIAISFSPNVSIAIGAGEKKVRFWKTYSKLIMITTPTFIFSTFFWPRIEQLLKNVF